MMKKKKNSFRKLILIYLVFLSVQPAFLIQAQSDSTEKPRRKAFIILHYHCVNRSAQYISLQTITKANKTVEPLRGLPVNVYLGDDSNPSNLIGKVMTKEDGKGIIYLPASLKENWQSGTEFKIYAVSDSVEDFGRLESELDVTPGRVQIDTSTDDAGHHVTAKVMLLQDSSWVPASDVEIKIGIRRLGGSILPIGEEENYTTDSAGIANADFTVENIPGDREGQLEIVARIDDHEQMGTLESTITAPWGKSTEYVSHYGERSLWARGNRVPLWLLSIAVFIIVSVWGSLVYLVYRFYRLTRNQSVI
ncbi:MAG: hypothetical protein U0V49_04405 [Saprospiraceae bacterium]